MYEPRLGDYAVIKTNGFFGGLIPIRVYFIAYTRQFMCQLYTQYNS